MMAWIFVLLLVLLLAALVTIPLRRRDPSRRFGPYNWAGGEQSPPEHAANEHDKEDDGGPPQPGGVRPLAEEERAGFAGIWSSVEGRFEEDPKTAVVQADLVVSDIMEARGLPVKELEQHDIEAPVDPNIIETYRAAHQIAVRQKRGEARAEYLRKAMDWYRALFDRLVGDRSAPKQRHEPEQITKRGTDRKDRYRRAS